MAVPTPELTITTPPRTPAPGVPSVHLADMQQVVALGPPTRPTAKRPPARPGGSAPRPRVEPPTPPSPPPPPPPGPGPGPGPGVRSDCRDATPDGGITVGCLRFCRAKLDKTGDVPGVCRRWCRNVARDSDRVTGWYRWCRPARVSGVPIWAYSAASGSTTVTKA